jgi:hypothetical protein
MEVHTTKPKLIPIYEDITSQHFPSQLYTSVRLFSSQVYSLPVGMHQLNKLLPTPPIHAKQMRQINHGVLIHTPWASRITNAIWERMAIMGTDGSVQDPIATYSFAILLLQAIVEVSVKGGGFFLQWHSTLTNTQTITTKAAALLAGLSWIQTLLSQFPNHTDFDPPPSQYQSLIAKVW